MAGHVQKNAVRAMMIPTKPSENIEAIESDFIDMLRPPMNKAGV